MNHFTGWWCYSKTFYEIRYRYCEVSRTRQTCMDDVSSYVGVKFYSSRHSHVTMKREIQCSVWGKRSLIISIRWMKCEMWWICRAKLSPIKVISHLISSYISCYTINNNNLKRWKHLWSCGDGQGSVENWQLFHVMGEFFLTLGCEEMFAFSSSTS